MNNWSYIAFHLRCRTGHQCAAHFKNLIVAGHVPQEKHRLSCRGASAAFIGEEDWAKRLTDKWQEASMRDLQGNVQSVLNDAVTNRVYRHKGGKAAAKFTKKTTQKDYESKAKDYASKMFQLQVLRVVPRPHMPPIQILPPDFPEFYPQRRSGKWGGGGTGPGQDNSRPSGAENVQIYQPGTASKTAPLFAPKSRGEQGKMLGLKRAAPTTLREANEAENASAWGNDMADQDFNNTLSSRSTVSAGGGPQSGIVLVMREFMGCHTLDIINMILQGAESQSAEEVDGGSSLDAKDQVLHELKSLTAFGDALMAGDTEARKRKMRSDGQLCVGSCRKVYSAVQSIAPDDAHLVREDIMSVALTLCDVLNFQRDNIMCLSLNLLVKALERLKYTTPQLLDRALFSCICIVQDTAVLLEQCGSPSQLNSSRALIQVNHPLQHQHATARLTRSHSPFPHSSFSQWPLPTRTTNRVYGCV